MKIIITESQFESIKSQSKNLIILDESNEKYNDILTDEELEDIILKYKGKNVIK